MNHRETTRKTTMNPLQPNSFLTFQAAKLARLNPGGADGEKLDARSWLSGTDQPSSCFVILSWGKHQGELANLVG